MRMLSRAFEGAQPYDSFQFVRNGYYCIDAKDSSPEHLVFNRIVSLKSSFKLPKKIEKGRQVPLMSEEFVLIRLDWLKKEKMPCMN